HIHQEQDPLFELIRNPRHAPAGFRTSNARWYLGHWISVLAEQGIANGEPHIVVPADALVLGTAFIETVRDQEALVEMTEACGADVLHDYVLEIGCDRLRQHRATCFDHAGDRQRVPERFAEPVTEQKFLLIDSGIRSAFQEPSRSVDHRRSALLQFSLPCLDSRPAIECPRRNVFPACVETSVQTIAGFDLQLRIVGVRHDLVARVGELCHSESQSSPTRATRSWRTPTMRSCRSKPAIVCTEVSTQAGNTFLRGHSIAGRLSRHGKLN